MGMALDVREHVILMFSISIDFRAPKITSHMHCPKEIPSRNPSTLPNNVLIPSIRKTQSAGAASRSARTARPVGRRVFPLSA
jgi:hypothetical protein